MPTPVDGGELAGALAERGYHLAAGVPCSHLSPLVDAYDVAPLRYVPAVNEGSALAFAAGAELGGRRAVVLLQNSGLGNLLNPLTSLAVPFEVPLLLFISLRGWPDPGDDEPQHGVMGPATEPVLAACGVPTGILSGPSSVADLLARAEAARRGGRPFAVLVPRRSISGGTVGPAGVPGGWGRPEVVAALARALDGPLAGALVLGGTGYLGRELFAAADQPANFYLQGAMGHLTSLGAGLATAVPDRTLVLLDGDGAALMHLGALAMIGAERMANLVHVVVDNGCYESTGGQPTVSPTVDWRRLAGAVGYLTVVVCHDGDELNAALDRAGAADGPVMIVARVAAGAGGAPPRATSVLSPGELTARFRAAVANELAGSRR